MEKLYHEICVRFPEVSSQVHRGDEKLPYLMMGHLAEWLKSTPQTAITPELLARVQAFAAWCEEQPSGRTAGDDLLTILVVGFYEKLFQAEHLRALLPQLISKDTFTQNAEYLRTWVGDENYEKAARYLR